MNISCMQDRIACLLDEFGVTAKVTFLRIDTVTSVSAHPLYGERKKEDKVYHRFEVKGVVEENPKHNVYGRSGGEAQGDLRVTFYDHTEYVPEEHDRIEWRGMDYEVTGTEPILPTTLPNGEDTQAGWVVLGRKWSE